MGGLPKYDIYMHRLNRMIDRQFASLDFVYKSNGLLHKILPYTATYSNYSDL